MRNFKNEVHVEGYIYESSLEKKVTGEKSKNPGTTYITGTLSIATDKEMTNIVPIHYSYVTATTSTGNANATFTTLEKIIDHKLGIAMVDGSDKASIVSIDTSIALNEFYSDRNGKTELVSVKRNEGGFIHVVSNFNEKVENRNKFKCDIIATKFRVLEADEEKGTAEKGILSGYIFDFRKAILPVDFTVLNPAAIRAFESLEVSSKNPYYSQISGAQISQTVKKVTRTESMWGEDMVEETTSSHKDWVITGAQKATYEWDTEEEITVEQLKEKLADRETYLASVKQRHDEYAASKPAAKATPAPAATSTPDGDFDF